MRVRDRGQLAHERQETSVVHLSPCIRRIVSHARRSRASARASVDSGSWIRWIVAIVSTQIRPFLSPSVAAPMATLGSWLSFPCYIFPLLCPAQLAVFLRSACVYLFPLRSSAPKLKKLSQAQLRPSASMRLDPSTYFHLEHKHTALSFLLTAVPQARPQAGASPIRRARRRRLLSRIVFAQGGNRDGRYDQGFYVVICLRWLAGGGIRCDCVARGGRARVGTHFSLLALVSLPA
ncbi:hypothetical protein K438DRAFT_1031906 [Mycena galopus ATCC 62051]|nr:hypothetical protein K438DRAFT_1031906 [Mycena galopus ATCC 62051]